MKRRTLYVFVDESGNFDFAGTGTRHFVMSAIFTTDPGKAAFQIHKLRYRLLENGIEAPYFHASEDEQRIRNLMFANIQKQKVKGYAFWVNKDYLQPKYTSPASLYLEFGIELAEYIVHFVRNKRLSAVVIVFDKAVSPKEQRTFKTGLKPILRPANVPIHVFFHRFLAEPVGQIADYLSWANYVKLERQEVRPFSALPTDLKGSHELNYLYR